MGIRTIYFESDVCKAAVGGMVTYSPVRLSFGSYGSADLYTNMYIEINDDGNYGHNFDVEAYLVGYNIHDYNDINGYLPIKFEFCLYKRNSTQGTPDAVYTNTPNETGYWTEGQQYSFKTARAGENGEPTRTNTITPSSGRALLTGVAAGLGCKDTNFKVVVNIYYSPDHRNWISAGSGNVLTGYAPGWLSITAPSPVYVNGINRFVAPISSEFTSRLSMTMTGYFNGQKTTFAGLFPPVRNDTAPYITSGQSTSNIYWYGNIFSSRDYSNFQYTLLAELLITDPGNSSFKTLGKVGKLTSYAYYRNENDLSGFTMSLSFTDMSGYYSQFGVLLHNTGTVIRASYSVGLKYGAAATIYVKKFKASSGTLIQSYSSDGAGGSGTYDQYVPDDVNSVTTECYVMAWGAKIATTTFSANIESYAAPTFSELAVHRCDQDGTANDNGAYVRIEWGVLIASINYQNAKSLIIDHPAGRTSYNPLTSYTQTGELIVAADPDNSYEINFMLSDSIYNGATAIVRTITLSTAGVIMDWLYGGKGVSFGKVAEIENAIEISPTWDLIAYKMLLGDVNVVNWIKEIASRMDAIEQFASNTGSTTQFQVTFYNGYEILKREWVLKNGNAIAPYDNPVRESTETTSYSFVGWALTNGATSADPNALLDVTSYRNIYAAFSQLTRYYSIRFCNVNEVLETFEQAYHSDPSYSSYTYLSPTPPTGGTFVGWMPSGRYPEDNIKAQAYFYYDQEITDSWAEIVAACADGTYKEKYKPGNWKMLDLGNEGNIKMRIKGLNLHRMAGQNKAPISWEADNALATKQSMNTAAQKVYEEDADDGFTFDRTDPLWFYQEYAHYYKLSKNADSSSNVARMTVVVTATGSTKTRVGYYKPSAAATGTITVYMNGTKVVNGSSMYNNALSTFSATEMTLASGDSVTYVIEAYAPSTSDTVPFVGIIEYTDPNNASRITRTDTIEKVDACVGYEGGAIGGFAKSQLHSYLQSTIKPLFPEALRLGLKKMRLIQCSMKSKAETPNYELVENDWMETDLFIPSSEEILGNNAGNTNGVDMDMWGPDFRRKEEIVGSTSYWCRDVYTNGSTSNINQYSIVSGNSTIVSAVIKDYYPCNYTKPVYICFCT